VQADRVGHARRLAAETHAVVVLKGARTVVAAPDGWAAINPTGNPGMGTGGSGDVLTGVIGGLLAQGVAPLAAARLGVWVHGAAGDRAAAARGQLGLIAGDLLAELPPAFAALA
jgi:NAD(P)H-hydrate epimerase